MKETGTIHGFIPNEGATNESGFTALPGGYRTGDFAHLGEEGCFGSSAELDSSYAVGWTVWYGGGGVGRLHFIEQAGFSVRLVRD